MKKRKESGCVPRAWHECKHDRNQEMKRMHGARARAVPLYPSHSSCFYTRVWGIEIEGIVERGSEEKTFFLFRYINRDIE